MVARHRAACASLLIARFPGFPGQTAGPPAHQPAIPSARRPAGPPARRPASPPSRQPTKPPAHQPLPGPPRPAYRWRRRETAGSVSRRHIGVCAARSPRPAPGPSGAGSACVAPGTGDPVPCGAASASGCARPAPGSGPYNRRRHGVRRHGTASGTMRMQQGRDKRAGFSWTHSQIGLSHGKIERSPIRIKTSHEKARKASVYF